MSTPTRAAGSLALVVVLLLTAALALAATPESRTVPLAWKSNLWSGAWVEAGELALRSYLALGANPTVLEAEAASAITWRAGGGAKAEAGAGGGAYAASPERVEFFLQVNTPGKYWVWYRLRATEAGEARHLAGINGSLGAPIWWVKTELPANAWTWVRAEGQFEFRAGVQELQTDQWPAGIAVDQIALSTDEAWKPPAAEPVPGAVKPESRATGDAATAEVYATTVLHWDKVEWDRLELSGGKADLAYSTDGGKTWQPVPAGGDLSGVKVQSDGRDRLRFRATLTRAADGQSPAGGGLKLTYTGDRDDLFSLQDAVAQYCFSRKNGALAGVQHKATGRWLTPHRVPQPIFALRIKPVAETPSKDWETVTSLDATCLSPGQAEAGAKVPTWKFVYELTRPDGKATVTLRAAQTGPGELTWTGTVAHGMKQHEVVELTYPIFSGAKISDDPQGDTMLITGNYLVRFPAMFGHFLYWWPTQTAPLMDLHNATEGLTVVAHDTTMRSTGISCRGLEREAVEIALVKVIRVKAGGSFTGAPHLSRVHAGDWHAMALVERQWLAQAWPSGQPPLWLAECDGWWPAGWSVGWYNYLGDTARRVERDSGFGWIQYWNFQVPGTTWTLPCPNQVNGSEEDLRWGIDQFHRQGIRTTFYIQGLLYDPAGDGSKPDDPIGHLQRKHIWPGYELPLAGFADRWAARDEDGKIAEWSPTEREMCYASQGFQEYKRHWALDIFMDRLGADGIYWDSLSRGRTCWATNHGHGDDPGMWGKGAQENHGLIMREARKKNPGATFATEGPPVDTLGAGCVDVHLDNTPSLDVVRFLFPKMLVYLGSADGADPQRKKSFLYGCRFDGISTDETQQALLRIRRATKQYLYPATPLDTLGLTLEGTPGVQARQFLCDRTRAKGCVVTILNEQKVAGATLTVDTSGWGPVKQAWLVDPAGEGPLPGGEAVNGGKAYRIPVPAVYAASVLLLAGAEPRATVSNEHLLSQGGQSTVTVKLENLLGGVQTGTVRVVTPKGFSSAPAPFVVGGTGEKAQTVRLVVKAGDNAPLGLVDLPVEIKPAGSAAFVKPATLYVDRPVRVTPEWVSADKLRVTVENGSLQARGGTVAVQMAAGELSFPGGAPRWTYALAPGQKTSFEAALAGGLRCEVPWAVKGTVQCGKLSWPFYAPFRPGILNGGLERYAFRSDIPDYWWGSYVDRRPMIWGTGEYAVDTSQAAEGTHSFKVVGKADEWRAANLDMILKPEQTYRFHCQIRRTANSPRIYASIYLAGFKADGSDATSCPVGQQGEGPLNEWQTFEATFTTPPASQMAGARLYLYNMNTDATAWFDDIRLVPEEK